MTEVENKTANSSFEISIVNGKATIVAMGDFSKNTIQYNSGSPRFSCYGGETQQSVSLYKEVIETIELGDPYQISLDKTNIDVKVGDDNTYTVNAKVLDSNGYGLNKTVTWSGYSSSLINHEINGNQFSFTINDIEGSLTINAEFNNLNSVSFVINITKDQAIKGWTLITNASELLPGDEIIIASKSANYAISTEQKSNNRGQAAINKSVDGKTLINTPSDSVQKITVEEGTKENTFSFNTGSGYLYAASTSNNYLRTQTTNNDNSSWNILISSTGIATIKAQGTNTINWLRYNSSSSLFSCYKSGQGDICIYKNII